MEATHFAPAERADEVDLQQDIEKVCLSPVINEVMNIVGGLLAVLNEHRQILAVNEYFLQMLKLDDAETLFGLRPGEVIHCIHAQSFPGGCGTSEFCATCGAAMAIVTALGDNKPVEQNCAVTIQRNHQPMDLFFRVRCCPLRLDEKKFLLLFLQDITKQKQWAFMERAFFHDLNNIVHGISTLSDLMSFSSDGVTDEQVKTLQQLALRLKQEISIQKCLSETDVKIYRPVYLDTSLDQIFQEIENIFANHATAENKFLRLPDQLPFLSLKTDLALLIRILSNMIVNALEASVEGGNVDVSVQRTEAAITFCVRNAQKIPEEIGKRIFQRNFSTKEELGRGLGTYLMKHFGEQVLGGKVDFTSSEQEGTCFRFQIKI